jgi:small redox-active disulfide protein 2
MDYKDLKISKMDIKILGTGCPKCKTLESLTRDVVAKNGIDATVSKVEDIMEIMNYGVMTTPALVVNGKVEIKGRVPSAEEIKQVLIK